MGIKKINRKMLVALFVCILLVSGYVAGEELQIVSAKGQREFNKGNYSTALKIFSDGLEQSPDNLNLQLWKAICLSRMGNYDKALLSLKKIADNSATDSIRDFEIGYAYYSLKDFDNAEKSFLKVLKSNPGNNSANYFAGRACLDNGNNEKALSYFEKVKGDFEKDAIYYSAVACYRAGNKECATEKFNSYLAGGGTNSQLAKNSNKYLDDMDGGSRAVKRWKVKARGYMEYDDNIILVDSDSKSAAIAEAKNHGLDIDFPATDESDWRYVYKVKGSLYPFVSDLMRMDLTASLYNSTHMDLTEYNLNYTTAGTGITFNLGKLLAAIRYDLGYSILDGKGYKRAHMPSVELKYSRDKATFRFTHLYSDEHFFRFDGSSFLVDKTGHVNRSELMLFYRLNNSVSFWGSYEYAAFSRGPIYEADMNTVGAGLSLVFLEKNNLIFRAGYHEKDYANKASDFWYGFLMLDNLMTERNDDNFRISVEYIRKINDSLSFSAGINHSNNDSNHVLNDYERNSFSLGLVLNR